MTGIVSKRRRIRDRVIQSVSSSQLPASISSSLHHLVRATTISKVCGRWPVVGRLSRSVTAKLEAGSWKLVALFNPEPSHHLRQPLACDTKRGGRACALPIRFREGPLNEPALEF